ncbi:MAG: polysaccharide biosynthesis tyrosine autokinase, partial [Planctomycetota bacterium]
IELVGQHPEVMRAVALHLTDGLNRLARRNRVAQLESFVRKLEESKAKTDAELETVRLELARVNDMLRSEDTDLGAEVRRLERLRAEEADARMELEMLELQLQQAREAADWPALRKRFGIEQNEDITVVLVNGNPLRETLRQQIRQLEDLQTRYTAEHPRLLEVQRNLRLTIRRLQDEGYVTAEGKVPPLPTPREERMLAEIQTRAKALEQMQVRLEARVRQRERLEAELKAAAPDSAAEEDKRRARALMDDLERLRDQEAFHRSNSRRLYNLLAESRMLLDQVRQERRFATDNAPSASLQSPNVKLDGTLGLALGVLLGCFAAFLRESVDHRLHTPFDIYYHLRMNYLGVIPYRSAKENVVISSDTPDSNLAEMYAHLRNNIRYGRTGKPEKSLLVVSATQGEGKSTIATNLAISYALEGNSVVLVDADLRRPRSHKLVDVLEGERSVNEGLSECLAGEADLPQVLYPTTTPGLSILPAGGRVRNPPKLLNGPRTAEIIRHLEDQFDIVIIDCPAMLPVVDGTTLSPLVRGVLLVVAADEVEIAEVRMALYRLQHVGAPLVGAVLNKVRERLSSYYYGYRYRTDYRSIYATDDET